MIYTDGLRLRAPERSDIPSFVAWLNDPQVRQGLFLKFPLSRAEEEQWFDDMLKRPQPEHPMVIEIQDGDQWVSVGNCGFHDIDWRSRGAEVGIFIGEKSYWNQGYGTRVMGLILKHGFTTLNLNRIFLRVFANNPRAIRAYEKAGFIHEGRLRQSEFQDGQYHDTLIMSVLRQEWTEEENN
jgi:diamine N-acetyltransferase